VTIHLVENLPVGHPYERPVVPGSEGHEVVERLVTGRDVLGVHAGGDGLDALPLAREAKSDQVGPQGLVTVLVTYG